MEELISIQDVSYIYNDGKKALQDVNISVGKGEKIAIMGPNGAGKSTLFGLLNGILKPSSGIIKIDKLETVKKNLPKIRRDVGVVFQDSDDQLFNSSVRQEIAYGLLNIGIFGEELNKTIKWALEVVGMEGYEDKSPHNLSGGEKKRIALASVLAMKPKVLVLDEPTASLDPRGVSKLIKLLDYINKEFNITLIFSTHDVDIVPLLADRVYLIDKGKIVLKGSTEEVFDNKEIIRKMDLRLPRVAHLVEILEKDGEVKVDRLPLTIGQARKILKNRSDINV